MRAKKLETCLKGSSCDVFLIYYIATVKFASTSQRHTLQNIFTKFLDVYNSLTLESCFNSPRQLNPLLKFQLVTIPNHILESSRRQFCNPPR